MAVPKRRIAGIAASIPAGYVLGRTQGGEGDVGLISISELGQSMVASGAVVGGGSAPVTVAAGTGIGVSGGPAYTISNTGVLSNIAGTGISVSGATGNVTIGNTGVTSNVAGSGISVSGATGTSTISLAAIADLRVLANISGGSAVPTANTMTAIMDATLGSTQGNITYRNATVWTVLPVATNVDTREAQIKALVQDGSGQNPKWSAVGHYVWKRTVSAATTTVLPACTYNNGTAGVGATLTGNSNGAITAQDGITLDASVNNTLLVKDQADQKQNGVYWVTQAGSGGTPFILTRMEGLNDYTSGGTGMFFPVASGTTQGQTIWMSAISQTTFGSDNITFAKVAGAGAAGTGVTSAIAGTGISVSSATGAVTISNTGVTSIVAGTNVTISGATGAVTVNAPNAGAGNYLGRRVLSGSGTYTPTTGTASIVIKMVGGGPGGGGVPATSSVQQSEGSGGGSGAVIETYLTSGFSGVSYSVGAAGAGSSGANGTNGGDTTFDTRTAGGGTGGLVGVLTGNGVAGSAGGATAGTVAGDIQFAGRKGWFSSEVLNGGAAISGRGADAPLGYGNGGAEVSGSAAGTAATGYGSGGGGAINAESQSARAGGAGTAGIIIIDEYGPSAATSGVLSGLTTGKVPYATSASALGNSEITDTGGTGGVYIGSATGGQKGNGTLNAQGLYINGVPVAGARSLFAEVMSIKPTQSNTGLTSWSVQQASATVTDGTQGVSLFQPAQSPTKHQGSYITKLVPATPYTVTALIAHTGRGQNNNAVQLGWWNGVTGASAKSHTFHHSYGDGFYVVHFNDGYANGATLAVDVGPDGINHFGPITWYRLTDDGTTAKFWISQDGDNWITFFSVTKSGSFLGASGFTNLVFGVDPTSQACYGNLLSWAVT